MNTVKGRPSQRLLNPYIILLCILWITAVVVVNPSGDFPLNDDWSYGRTVKNLLEEGRFSLGGWTSMPLLGQVIWGTLFCLPFGFSFTALRFSTLVLGLFGVLASYGIFREVETPRKVAFLGAVIFAVNPLYFQHSFTFMTDIPFTAVALLSIYFYLRGFRRNRGHLFTIGALFSAWAALIRQPGIVIPLVFAAAYFLRNGMNRENRRRVLPNLLISLGPFLLFNLWLQYIHGLPAKYNAAEVRISRALTEGWGGYMVHLLQRTSGAVIYLSIFLFPLLLLLIPGVKSALMRKDSYVILGGIVLLAASITLVWNSRSMPLLRNVLFDLGLGPPHLRDVYVLGLPNWPRAPVFLWYFVTFLGVAGGSLLLYSGFRAIREFLPSLFRRAKLDVGSFFLCGIIVMNFVPIIFIGYYDRYLVFFPVLLTALLFKQFPLRDIKWSSLGTAAALFVTLALLCFSWGGTHDYLSWNRARWKALDHLTADRGIPPTRIDGGFEFNGWFLYDPDYVETQDKSYWWIEDDEYAVTFGPMVGYEEIKRFPFRRWIPYGISHIHILRRIPRND